MHRYLQRQQGELKAAGQVVTQTRDSFLARTEQAARYEPDGTRCVAESIGCMKHEQIDTKQLVSQLFIAAARAFAKSR